MSTVPKIKNFPKDEKLIALTAYDRPSAISADNAGVDIVLVGDSLSNVILGNENTTSISMKEMTYHVTAVSKFIKNSLTVADLPFGSVQSGLQIASEHACELIRCGANAIKIEGGEEILELVEHLTKHGVPVMGHIGLTPQKVEQLGGHLVQGKTLEDSKRIYKEAKLLEDAGVFSLVMECIPMQLAKKITSDIGIPTIGIGSGPYCNGQVLVFHDLIGWHHGKFKFLKKPFGNVSKEINNAISSYSESVKKGSYPSIEESWSVTDELIQYLEE